MAETSDLESQWWERAIFYAIDVERFHDGNGDGVGDFQGLTEKVAYLADLGVTCIWLLPFFPSANRDNGYDITNYCGVDPSHGTLEDFIAFVHRAGEFGIRVLIDLVMQHTSDEHPWFQAARHDERSRFRKYYFWSANPGPLPPEHGSIFPGEESTVWTYDDVARAYYHHRFYAFEPGLDTDSEAVREEIRRVMDFWMSFGIGGFRVDAARYMVRLPLSHDRSHNPSHEVLHDIYSFAKQRRPNCLMLGEVDASREKMGSYFENEQVDMMFDFVLCSYLFLGLATQSSEAIRRGFDRELQPPPGREWLTMLRNLDEANLEWLSREDRQLVFDAFAPKPDMRIYDRGIRRRLGPMFDGDPRRLKLAHSLLFSLPGAPLIAYGDEIGMGEDLSLDGRNAARLPMQWSAGRNGGYSKAPQGKLRHKPKAGGRFGYQKVNVERQTNDEQSLLEHVRRLIGFRRACKVISRDHFELLPNVRDSVLAHRYRGERQQLVMLHNLSHARQSVDLRLDPQTERLHELFTEDEVEFENGAARLTLPPYGFMWLASHPPKKGKA